MKQFFSLGDLLFFLLMTLSSLPAHASTIYTFGSPNLHAIKTDDRLMGFFSSLARGSGCIFFFYQTENKFKSRIPIRIYETDGKFPDSTSNNDANGEIYVNGDNWTLRSNNLNAGCTMKANIVFPDFAAPEDERKSNTFKVTKKFNGLAIKILDNKHYIYREINNSFVEQKSYLVNGDIVIVLAEKGEYSFVQYTNPMTTKITKGWIKSQSIVSPFPD